MNYPTVVQSLTGGTRCQLAPRVSETETEESHGVALTLWRRLLRRWHLVYGDPLDLAHTLGYLGG